MLFKSSNTDNVKKLVQLIEETSDDKQALVRVKGKNVITPAGRIVQVPCKPDVGFLKVKKAMLFQPGEIDVPEGLQYAETVVLLKSSTNNYFKMPVVNDCRKDVILHKNTQLGYLEPIKSIAPLNIEERVQPVVNTIISSEADKPVDKQNFKHKETTDQAEANNNLTLTKKQLSIISNIDLAGLTYSQMKQVRQLMREGISFFSVNDQDIEYVKTPQMKINWKDQVPVQQNYNSISKQLYNEIKYNIEDLLNKQWIIHSHSEYSSPVVAARKKDGTIRLCCDYRKLNQKTIPDRHPLPRIQNVIDNLGGNKFFSLLDQNKSYHQLHLNPEGR